MEFLRPSSEEAVKNMEALGRNSYPGRGIIMGVGTDGRVVEVYWLMGRSDSSKSRELVLDGRSVACRSLRESTAQNPFGVLFYDAMQEVEGIHIVTNGDQTTTVAQAIAEGKSISDALATRDYEPDDPHFTPRISGLYIPASPEREGYLLFSRIRRDPTSGESLREYFNALLDKRGIGYCFHTYQENGDPLQTFSEDPYPVPLEGSLVEIAQAYWRLLSADKKIALVAKAIDPNTGETEVQIINGNAALVRE